MQKIKISFFLLVTCVFNVVGFCQTITFTIDPKKAVQTIDNIGASGAWYSERIGKYWPDVKRDRLAELLFSKGFDSSGNPLGIGLSCFRFNIGGGTAEQGDSSGIRDKERRVECFLSTDGTYNWNKQQGYVSFVRKAVQYGVENLIAFSNTPPVQFTKNGLGFKLEKDYDANLKDDKYGEYAAFLATVLEHFDKEGLHFSYVSPVNEPQWDWSNRFGQMNQEGSPWGNKEIYRITASLDSALRARRLSTKILVPEAGILSSLYGGSGHSSHQIQSLYGVSSPYYIGHLETVMPVVAGHSYFTDTGDSTTIGVRSKLRDTAAKYGVQFWQSEYSMLGDGYKEGKKGRIAEMDCALFLSKVIYHDLAIANATAWQFWNSWEPGRPGFDVRYHLIVLKPNTTDAEAEFTISKNLWALGHYSRFIRPGMQRIATSRSDGLNDFKAADDVMVSAFANENNLVLVAVNYTSSSRDIAIQMAGRQKVKSIKQYVTTARADENMKLYPVETMKRISLKPRSITTVVIER
jgi:O-glycosyl hydrolase